MRFQKDFKRFPKQLLAFLFLFAFMLQACSDGGDPPPPPASKTLSGTAAAGAPIVGTVTIKDSSSPAKDKFVTISADGKYTIDVSDLTAPFMMRADGNVGGRSYSLYSAAASADIGGTVNITPLTDLIVANIAGQVAATLYNSGNFRGITPAALNQAETNLQQRLQAVLSAVGLDASIDLLRATFNANHAGVDAVLDVLRVTVDPATLRATIENVINNQQIIDDLASQTDTTVIDSTGVSAGLTEFQQIVAKFDALSALFATSLPASNNAALLALFDGTNFLNSGENLASLLSEITTRQENIGLKFPNVTLESLTPIAAPTSADVSFSVLFKDGIIDVLRFKMNKVNGVWLLAGDQRIGFAYVDTFARKDHTGVIDTGVSMEISDDGGRGIDYAIVKGKGLPISTGGANGTSAGALFVNDTSNNSFRLAASGAAYNGINTLRITSGHNQFSLVDAAISQFGENEVYTVELWEDNATPGDLADDIKLASYSEVLGKRPYLNSELSAASFPTITTTQAAIHDFATAGGNLTVTWTLPAGFKSFEVYFFRSGEGGSHDSVSADVAGAATSVTLTIGAPTFTVQSSGINLYAEDVFGRELRATLNGQ
jgi:hypothetical protein